MDTPQIIAGRFRIEREIGKGGMGTVYRALHLGLERPVAVKILKKEIASDPEVAERFMREARTMARLRHAHAAMIFDAGRLADGRPFIVMEYVEGRTLAETLAREGRFAPERAVRVACDIFDVLAEAHRLGIVHRDLKPSNIMLSEAGGVCVLDFGIAKVLAAPDAAKTHPTTESGLVIGTPRYMSPEQCMGRRVGAASDLYSVGVMVYEMLAGEPPFVDQLSSAVLVKQATSAPPPLMAKRPEVPRQLALVVHTLLAKNPAHRPRSAEDASALLARSVAHAPRASAEQEVPPFSSTIAALNAGTSATLRAASVLTILLMLGAVIFGWSHSGQASRLPNEGRAETAENLQTDSQARTGARTEARSASSSARGARATEAPAPAAVVPESRVASRADAEAPLSDDAVQRIAQSISRGTLSEARLVRTKSGQLIAALHSKSKRGASRLYFMERSAGQFRVTAQMPLDAEGFRGADWRTEVADIDGDGYEEVICTGTNPSGKARNRRLVLYNTRSRETYTLHLAPEGRAPNAFRETWSRSAAPASAKAYRAAMRERAYAATKSF